MTRSPIWQAIAGTLSTEIAEGHYLPGDKLPTEAQLSLRFGVNRHTVRHALAGLAEAGLVHARRGAGVFVAGRPADYPLGRRVRFHENVTASGRSPSRETLVLETRHADAREAEALQLAAGASVHVYEGLSLADGVPLATFRSVFPAERFPGLLADLSETRSVTAALRAAGLADYTRASTRITAKTAPAVLALRLRLKEGAPILRSEAVNVDAAGRPVEFGKTWFAGDRVTLTVTPD
ncbi:phosphonate metabolism transcriptional regulator PhnF [Cereibacter changlensis JA139]|uniref:Phosphonate metabolism transcriptional regulator PhnF n=2 Tax=Cereibacter changlensis TaxID=402884 RepID=A0A2T4JNG7_9RHOB|nr:phosphonate metabolism transcriptional regulator PhnF [Cereibacter changlensis]PTE19454.1 phosphonate metabolism transcriptional regulator PhnF [Cereibacter changlensis JA139]PZX51210.1 GntR family phosphonate transport system transcriptional regulator [Cereibacter changlensis]